MSILSELAEQDFVCLHDVMLYTPTHHTAQIDHIVISRNSVFIIETKNYKGDIYGSEDAQYWKQYLTIERYRNFYKKEYDLYNPILQNLKHKDVVYSYIKDLVNINIIPIVCFLNRCQLHLTLNEAIVMQVNDLKQFILSHKTDNVSDELKNIVANTLIANNINSQEERERHKTQVFMAKSISETKEANFICPRCNAPLVLKTGQYGQFYGCSNFPKCRYTSKA